MASTDGDCRLVAVADSARGKHRLSEKDLDAYPIPKQNVEVTRDYLKGLNRGVGYTKSASPYVFERVAQPAVDRTGKIRAWMTIIRYLEDLDGSGQATRW